MFFVFQKMFLCHTIFGKMSTYCEDLRNVKNYLKQIMAIIEAHFDIKK